MATDKREPRADVGLIGLAVMGSNLALNMADHGFRVAVHNRNTDVTQRFIDENPATPGELVGCMKTRELVSSVRRPRRIVLPPGAIRRVVPTATAC